MRKYIAFPVLALAGLAFGMAARAEVVPGFYAGASLGEAALEINIDPQFDESDTSFKLFGGYTFNRYFALELEYFDGGEPEMDLFGGDASISVALSGLNASAVAALPLGEVFTLFGKLGFASYDVEVTGRVGGTTVVSEDATDEDLSYGVGGELNFGALSLRAEYQIIDFSDGDFTTLTIGGLYRF